MVDLLLLRIYSNPIGLYCFCYHFDVFNCLNEFFQNSIFSVISEFAEFSLFLESHSVFSNCFLIFLFYSIERIPSKLFVLFRYEVVI